MEDIQKNINTENPNKMDENWRNTDGTFKQGHPDFGGGRPKGKTLKEYKAQKFREMTDEEKELWIKENKVSPDLQWRMAEGNPTDKVDIEGNLILNIEKEVQEKYANPDPKDSSNGQPQI